MKKKKKKKAEPEMGYCPLSMRKGLAQDGRADALGWARGARTRGKRALGTRRRARRLVQACGAGARRRPQARRAGARRQAGAGH